MQKPSPKYSTLCQELCIHFHSYGDVLTIGTRPSCDAFPDGIPEELYEGEVPPHTKKYPGDNGILFKPKIKLPKEFWENIIIPFDNTQLP
jgi:hypothetical protein